MKRSIKLLAIAPSESIQLQIREIAKSKEDLIIDAYVGNLYSGVEIVKQKLDSSYDAILSRGETAAMIKKAVNIPIIEIPLSFYDILHAMKLADNFHEPYAIVAFTAVTNCAHMLRDLMQLNLEIHTLFSLDDAAPVLEKLKQRGFHLIVSGMGIDSIARQKGLNSIMITTGRDSIVSAVDQAMRLCQSLKQMKEKELFFEELLQKSKFELMAFDENKELVYSNLKKIPYNTALSIAVRELQNPITGDSTVVKMKNGTILSAFSETTSICGSSYTLFYYQLRKAPYTPDKNELQMYSRSEAADTYLVHYLELSSSSYESTSSMQQIVSSALPVMILGENGVGKEQIAAMLYTQGKLQNHPYVVIDFKLMTDKTWAFFTSHVNSPLSSEETTIYFRSLDVLNVHRTEKLKSILYDTGACKRNRIILSYTILPGGKIPAHVLDLQNQLGCITIRPIPLRERLPELHALASLYISTLNMDLAKQVIGFTPAAQTVLKHYQWPGNLIQFKRVITQLVTCTSSPYIQEESVRRILDLENANLTSASALSSVLNLNKTLEEIERDVVRTVVAECGGNQSKAAMRLGICRTTLWRILNKT